MWSDVVSTGIFLCALVAFGDAHNSTELLLENYVLDGDTHSLQHLITGAPRLAKNDRALLLAVANATNGVRRIAFCPARLRVANYWGGGDRVAL